MAKTALVEYDVTDAAIFELKDKYQGLKITDMASYKEVSCAIAEVRGFRVSVEARRKELKADALAYGRRVDAEAKRITEQLFEVETPLKVLKKAEDDRKAAIKEEKERKDRERVYKIQDKIAAIQRLVAGSFGKNADEIEQLMAQAVNTEITPEEYMEFEERAGAVKLEVFQALSEAKSAREKWEQEEKESAAEREAQKAEGERLAKEQTKIDEEKAKIELEKRVVEEAHRLEAQRIAAEAAKAKEQLRQDALKPDREKLVVWADQLLEITPPVLKNAEAIGLANTMLYRIHGIADKIKEEAEKIN